MEMEDVKNENAVVHVHRSNGFNSSWALLLGCCVIALGIFLAGGRVADRIPHSMHGSFHGIFNTESHMPEPQDFMSSWSAAQFLQLQQEQLMSLVAAGELAGTYTVFQVEERMWLDSWHFHEDSGWGRSIVAPPTAVQVDAWGNVAPVPVQQQEYEMVLTNVYVFSRERLTEWLMARIDG